MDSQTLMRNQSINAEQLHSEHQQEQEHSDNVLEQQQQFQQQVQPKEYYNLETEEHIQLTREEEEELAKCQGPVPEFHQLTARQERTMRKFHKSRYQEYEQQRARYERYNKKAANIRKYYIAMARTKRPIEGDNVGAISSEMAVEDKVTAMDNQLAENLKIMDNASVDITMTNYAEQKTQETRIELLKIGQTLSWFASVTGNDSLRMYTGAKYTAINTFLRCKADLLRENPTYKENDPKFREALISRIGQSLHKNISQEWLNATELMANNANSLLRKVALPKDLVLTRHISADGLKPFGLSFSKQTPEEEVVNAINGMGGQVYREDGVCSTSYGSNRIGGNIELVILAHKGTNGVFAEKYITDSPGENEVILAPGQAFRILKAEKKHEGEERTKIYVETIPSNDQGVAA